jgi:hypothetical protein
MTELLISVVPLNTVYKNFLLSFFAAFKTLFVLKSY